MPSEKALGSLRPLTRWKPRSPVAAGPVSASRLLLNTPPPSRGASTGAMPALCAMPGLLGPLLPPGPATDPAASASVSGRMLAARLRYHRRKTVATSSKIARPATPPTIPPARTEVGVVLLSLLLLAPEREEADDDADAALADAAPPATCE